MSRRKHVKPVRRSMAVFIGFPKLIEGEDYTLIVMLLMGITIALSAFISPKYLLAGVAFDIFLLVIWQLYSGVALKAVMNDRKVIAKYARENESRLFYRNLVIWVVAGLAMLVGFFTMYFLFAQ